MSLYAVNLATPTIQTAPMGPAARPSYIRRRVQFSDIIIYENWTTDVMEREKVREAARCRRLRKFRWLFHHSQSNGEP